jgi:hypothetical protein
VVQSEHDARKRAEKVVEKLCQFLMRQQAARVTARDLPQPCDRAGFTAMDHFGHVGRKRFADTHQENRQDWSESTDVESQGSFSRRSSWASNPWKRQRSNFHDETYSTTSRSISPGSKASSEVARAPMMTMARVTQNTDT